MIGVLAAVEKKPVGLLLSTDDNTAENYRIHSFLVDPRYRKMGIGSAMIDRIEGYVQEKGARKIDLYYRTHWPSRVYLEKILSGKGWSDPRKELILVKGDAQNVNKLFMHHRLDLPQDYEFDFFRNLTSEDRASILNRKKEENWYLDYLDPFVQENTIFHPASLVLRYRGQVIGWVISHLITPGLNEFTALFIDPEHRPFKLAHLLMRQAITLQQKANIPQFLITSKEENYVMSRFLLRHARETGVFLTRSYYCEKQF